MNEAARLVTHTSRTEHIEPVLIHLHWLPIKGRFQYKISTMTFKALHNQAPEYIKNLLHPYTPSRGLRSSSKYLLHEPRYNPERYGSRAFQNAAPRIWNSLTINLQYNSNLELFKKDLKTYFSGKRFPFLHK